MPTKPNQAGQQPYDPKTGEYLSKDGGGSSQSTLGVFGERILQNTNGDYSLMEWDGKRFIPSK